MVRLGQSPHRAAAKAERVLQKVVIVEHAPGPADHGVGMDVGHVIEREFAD